MFILYSLKKLFPWIARYTPFPPQNEKKEKCRLFPVIVSVWRHEIGYTRTWQVKVSKLYPQTTSLLKSLTPFCEWVRLPSTKGIIIINLLSNLAILTLNSLYAMMYMFPDKGTPIYHKSKGHPLKGGFLLLGCNTPNL